LVRQSPRPFACAHNDALCDVQDSDALVAVIGSGSIGVGWAATFARSGFDVGLYDVDSERLEAALRDLRAKLDDLARFELLDEPPATVAARVTSWADLGEALRGASYVQECAPEELALKRELFARLDRESPATAVIASSSSTMPCSAFAADLPGRGRCLVAHPGNPPYLLPVVELVPAPFTRPDVVDRAAGLLGRAGMSVVRVRAEIEGFVFNRLQGALLREAYCLVRDGVASVEDVDRVVRDGLGRRWAVIGPFETVDLNTRGGIEAHAGRLGPAYERMGAERGQHDPWTPDLVGRVTGERRHLLPLERWEERVAWRDRMLMALERARRRFEG
jgi:3-hydroxyacyl-CoA dehydrogenase